MYLGAIAPAKHFLNDSEESKTFQSKISELDAVGMLAFGQMPFFVSGPDEVDYNWSKIDAIAGFAKQHDLILHYNAVINHADSVPEYFRSLTPEMRRTKLLEHVRIVLRHMSQAVYKLVNEPFRDPEEQFLGTDTTKVELIKQIFQTAKLIDDKSIMMLNDHIPMLRDDPDKLRARYLDLIQRLIKNGTPIDAIGIEGHLGYRPKPFQLPSDEDIKETLDDFSKFNLPILITEFDLSFANPSVQIDPYLPFDSEHGKFANWFEYQAFAYQHFYDLCQEFDIHTLMFWGFYEPDMSNLPERAGTGFYTEGFEAKPDVKVLTNHLNKKTQS